jgi:hypothetical protein
LIDPARPSPLATDRALSTFLVRASTDSVAALSGAVLVRALADRRSFANPSRDLESQAHSLVLQALGGVGALLAQGGDDARAAERATGTGNLSLTFRTGTAEQASWPK